MKVNLDADTARKTLAAIPADTQDQDLRRFRQRLERGLAANAVDQRLSVDELDAVTSILVAEVNTPKHGDPENWRPRALLRPALRKLQAIRDRMQEAGLTY